MSTDTMTREQSATHQRASVTRRYSTAAALAVAGIAIAVIWVVAAVIPVMGQVDELARTAIPGEVTVDIAEPGEHVIYYERSTWLVSMPMDPELAVEVTGPDGAVLDSDPYELAVQYRLPGQAGEVHATFEAAQAGVHTVAVEGDVPDDAAIAVGPSLVGQVLGGLLLPAVLVMVALVLAAVIAVRAAGARSVADRG